MITQIGRLVPGPARRHRAYVIDALQAVGEKRERDRARAVSGLPPRRQRPRRGRSHPHHRAAHRDPHGGASLGRDLRPVARRNAESADRRRRAHRPVACDGAGARPGRRAGSGDSAPDRGVSGVPQGPVPLESRRPSRVHGPRFRTTSGRSISIPSLRLRTRPWLARASRSRITRKSRVARSSNRRRRRPYGRSKSIRESPTHISRWRKSGAPSNGTGGRPKTNIAPRSRCRRAARRRTASTRSFSPAMSRFGEAKAEADRACDVDPFCLVVTTSAAWVRYAAGEFDTADRSQPARARHGRRLHARAAHGSAPRCWAVGRPEEAVVELTAAAGPGDDDSISLAWLAHAKALAGARDEAGAIVARLEARGGPFMCRAIISRSRTSASEIATRRSPFSRKRAPIASLRVLNLNVEPRFEPLRRDPSLRRPAAAAPAAGVGYPPIPSIFV